MNRVTRRRRLVAPAMAATLVAVPLLAWLLWPSKPAIPGAERVRQYTNVRACMLTGAGGVTSPVAAAAWAGMRSASSSSAAMVSYLPVPAPASKVTALPYLASLVARQCSVIVAVGAAPVAAATAAAGRYRQVHFIVITPAGPAGHSASAVVRISSASAARLPQAVRVAVNTALSG